jgi:hypothetical protein
MYIDEVVKSSTLFPKVLASVLGIYLSATQPAFEIICERFLYCAENQSTERTALSSYSYKYTGATVINLYSSGRHKYHSFHVVGHPELPNLDPGIAHSHDKRGPCRGSLLEVVDTPKACLEALILLLFIGTPGINASVLRSLSNKSMHSLQISLSALCLFFSCPTVGGVSHSSSVFYREEQRSGIIPILPDGQGVHPHFNPPHPSSSVAVDLWSRLLLYGGSRRRSWAPANVREVPEYSADWIMDVTLPPLWRHVANEFSWNQRSSPTRS